MAEFPESRLREAGRLQREERFAEAVVAYTEVLSARPGLPDGWFNLAVCYRRLGFLPQSLQAYQNALLTGVARPEEVHLNRAVILTDLMQQHEAAERELETALKLNPSYAPALLNLANLYEDLGRRAQAAGLYERMLALDPLCFEALARLANLQPPSAPAPGLVERLEDALASPGVGAADRASLGFALGRMLDGRGDYARAFRSYVAANDASRRSAAPGAARYDRARQHALVDQLIAADVPATPAGPAGPPQPIFICGMFRSGSTLAEQMLAGIPGVHAGGELDFLPRVVAAELAPFPAQLERVGSAQLASIRDRYLEQLARIAPGATYVVDKRPDNFLYLGLIKSLFPAARIVHTTRDPLDNCLSIFFLHLDHRMGYALDLMDIGHYFVEYRRLMTHWKARFGDHIHDFDYDALVAAPQPALAGLCRFLGLTWHGGEPAAVAAPRAVKTASVWQVREPLYRHASGRARHYAAELGELAAYLAAAGAA